MWSAARNQIYALVRANACQNEISNDYILRAEGGSEFISQWGKEKATQDHKRDIMLLASPIGSTSPIGFLLACDEDFAAQSMYYIDLVCAMKESGGGASLISTFLQHFSDRSIKLSAILSVLTYYPKKFGFQFGNTCAEAERIQSEVADVDENVTYDKVKSNLYSRFSGKTKAALTKLIRLKLDNGKTLGPECVNVDPKTFFKNQCETGGFNMIKCNETKRAHPMILRSRRRQRS